MCEMRQNPKPSSGYLWVKMKAEFSNIIFKSLIRPGFHNQSLIQMSKTLVSKRVSTSRLIHWPVELSDDCDGKGRRLQGRGFT